VTNLKMQKGFSLLELLVAMLLLMVGFLATASVLWSSGRAGSFSRQMTTAANLSEDILEQLSSLSFSDPLLNDTGNCFVDFINPNLAATGFSRQIRVQDNTPVANTKTITVRISWNDRTSTKTRTYTALKRQVF
jgi:type IV pilus assembly protein PilV